MKNKFNPQQQKTVASMIRSKGTINTAIPRQDQMPVNYGLFEDRTQLDIFTIETLVTVQPAQQEKKI